MAQPLNETFYGAYNAQNLRNQQASSANMNQSVQQFGLLQKIQAQQEQNKVKEILTTSPDEATAMTRLQREGGTLGIQVAQQIGQLKKQKMEADQMGREQAVFSLQNIAANTIGGQPARPEISLPPDVVGPVQAAQPAVPGQINLDALRQQAAMTGPKGMEAYSLHKATEATKNQTAAIQLMGLQQRAREADQRSQDRALDRQARADAQEEARNLRREMMALTASMRQPRNLQLTTDAQGNQLIVNSDGTTRPLTTEDGAGVRKPIPADKPMTEFQGKAALYGTRAAQSDKVLKSLEDKISTTGLAAGQATGIMGNFLMSSEQRRVDQAQRDFVNAVLRQESGAVISDAEFANAKRQYFPAPGDDPKVISQKRANRQLAIQGFARMSGPKGAPDIQAIIDEPLLPGVSAITPTPPQAGEATSGYVEMRRTPDGRVLGKKPDGTIEEIK